MLLVHVVLRSYCMLQLKGSAILGHAKASRVGSPHVSRLPARSVRLGTIVPGPVTGDLPNLRRACF